MFGLLQLLVRRIFAEALEVCVGVSVLAQTEVTYSLFTGLIYGLPVPPTGVGRTMPSRTEPDDTVAPAENPCVYSGPGPSNAAVGLVGGCGTESRDIADTVEYHVSGVCLAHP